MLTWLRDLRVALETLGKMKWLSNKSLPGLCLEINNTAEEKPGEAGAQLKKSRLYPVTLSRMTLLRKFGQAMKLPFVSCEAAGQVTPMFL